MAGSQELRLVLLGKTGSGKSSCGNLILGESMFSAAASSLHSPYVKCETRRGERNGRTIIVVDTPGFLDTWLSDENLKAEVMRCITECAPGPHAFIIVLKVETLTKQELAIMKSIEQAFGKEAFKHAVVLFTHGDQLDDEMNIEEFVGRSKELQRFVEICGSRCHVIDNKYWKSNEHEYRNNTIQVEELMKTIGQMVEQNGGGYYTTEMLQMAEKAMEAEMIKMKPKKEQTTEELGTEAENQTWSELLFSAGTVMCAVGVAVGFGILNIVGIRDILRKFGM